MTKSERIAATHRALGRFIEEARGEIMARERYYIGWRSLPTDAEERGTKALTKEDAEQAILRLNKDFPHIHHYLVPAT